jgi:ABC-type sugar transport system ATPase subunit/ribose/xylose/arabinose/galactoside ABC-type transport system permease subunit
MARIAVALAHRARILLLDEPTSSLSSSEAAWLFEHIEALRASGVGILYISHRQSEIFQLADRILVLRDGRRVWFGATRETTPQQLVADMVGRDYAAVATCLTNTIPHAAPVRLAVEHLSDRAGRFRDVSLRVRAGEMLGIYGLVGAGRSEFAQAVFGLTPASQGRVEVDGRPIVVRAPSDAIAAGIAYVPEDRLQEALFRELSVRENTVIASLDRLGWGPLASQTAELKAVDAQLKSLAVRYRGADQPVRQLSGGNQQKTVLARWLLTEPKVLLLDEPTRGVDVGSKAELHRLLRDWVRAGNAGVMISSDLAEIIEHSDRVVVFRDGRAVEEFSPSAGAGQIAQAALLDEATVDARRSRKAARSKWSSLALGELGVLLACLLLAAWLSLTQSHFLTADNLVALLTNAAVWTILALGASIVIIAGGIDISIGAICAFGAAVAALVLSSSLQAALAIPLAFVAALAVGGAAGALNAAISLSGRIHPIVTTLGTMTVYRGLLIMLTGGEALTDLPAPFGRLANLKFLGVNGSIVLMFAVVAVVEFWQRRTLSGRYLFALGANPVAAHTVGISKPRVWCLAFGLGGLLAALAGLLELAQTGSLQSSMGTGYELRAIAAAVIGGTAITGGRGSAVGVLCGSLLMSLVHNALVLWQVSRYHSDLVIGGLILAAILWDLAWRKLEQHRLPAAAAR